MNERDRIRVEEFRQFKKEIRGSAEYLIIGIDGAKDKHHAFFGTATGKTLFRRLVPDHQRRPFDKRRQFIILWATPSAPNAAKKSSFLN